MKKYPKIGIRPTIDGRQGGVRESLEEKTMSLAKAVDSLHACRGIAVAQIIYQRIGAVIIADSDHRIQSRIHSLFTILTDNGVVLFVNSAHNI